MRLPELVRRDAGRCWLCGGDVDLDGPSAAPAAPSVDHVVPRALGGTSDPANLRLAHRRCNGRRGSSLPELTWPTRFAALDAAPLWPVVRRALRRPGEWELVAVLPTEDAGHEAERWLARAVRLVLGGEWEVRRDLRPPGLHAVALRASTPAALRHEVPRSRRRRGRRV